MSIEIQKVILAHHQSSLHDSVPTIDVSPVPPLGCHHLEMHLHLLHAHRVFLQLLHLALLKNVLQNIEILTTDLQRIL